MINIKKFISIAIEASIDAGKEILKVYESDDFQISSKEDKSPLTLADKNAHNKIVEYLEKTDIPILSEEGKHLSLFFVWSCLTNQTLIYIIAYF